MCPPPVACEAVPAAHKPEACDAAPTPPEPAPKPPPNALTCSVCSASFPSKTKLFKHLRDGCVAGLTAQIKSANAIVQVGYRGATSADAVDAQLRAAVGEGCRVVARSGAPPRAKAPLAVAAGAAAWGDVCACVLGGSSMDPGDWCAAANARIAAAFPGAACVVEVLGRTPLESRDDFQAQDFSSVRAEVLVPAALFGAFDADSDAGKAALKRLRDVATALLVAKRADGSAARRSWHAFADDDAAYERACCPDEGLSVCRLRKVNVASRGPFLVFAFQGDRFLRGMARRAAALAVAVALGWVDDVAAGDEAALVRPWACDDVEVLGPSVDPAADWMLRISRNSSISGCGIMVGMRFAIIDLPDPGLPIMSRLCPPLTAISTARRTACCPFTSAKSPKSPNSDFLESSSLEF